MSAQDKLAAFKKAAVENAEEFAKNQAKQSQSLDPQLSDVTAAFKKNRNEVVVGERVFVIKKFGIRDQIDLVPILGDALFVPLTALVSESGEMDTSGLTEAAIRLFGETGDGKLYAIFDLLLSETTLDGKPVDIERDFEDITEVIEVCVKVFEVHYNVFSKSPSLSKLLEWGQKFKNLQQ